MDFFRKLMIVIVWFIVCILSACGNAEQPYYASAPTYNGCSISGLTITCADGTVTTLTNGAPGKDGNNGQNGATGAEGPQGIAGAVGTTGTQGAQGIAGPTGAQGQTGAIGPIGAQGAQGVAGPTGPAGQQGIAGTQGPQGPQGPQGVAGTNGTSVISVLLCKGTNGINQYALEIGTNVYKIISTTNGFLYLVAPGHYVDGACVYTVYSNGAVTQP